MSLSIIKVFEISVVNGHQQRKNFDKILSKDHSLNRASNSDYPLDHIFLFDLYLI